MPRYARKVHASRMEVSWHEDDIRRPDTVIVCDHDYVDTGLLFPDGEPVLRAPNPIGFGRDEDW